MKYCKLKRLNKIKSNLKQRIVNISDLYDEIENEFGENFYTEKLSQRQQVYFHQLDRINNLINKTKNS